MTANRTIQEAAVAVMRLVNWYETMTKEYRPVTQTISERPVRSWQDCVELAEIVWTLLDKNPDSGELTPDNEHFSSSTHYARHAIAALVEGVIALGGGQRFDPRTGVCHG